MDNGGGNRREKQRVKVLAGGGVREECQGMGCGEGVAGERGKRMRGRTAESFQEERKRVFICHRQKQKRKITQHL